MERAEQNTEANSPHQAWRRTTIQFTTAVRPAPSAGAEERGKWVDEETLLIQMRVRYVEETSQSLTYMQVRMTTLV